MPRKQFQKGEGDASLGNVKQDNNGSLHKAAIFKIDDKGTILKKTAGIFLLNPTSWRDSKAANWVPNEVPGQSDPVLQWVSSGPRTVTFDALVTRDTAQFNSGITFKAGEDTNPVNRALSVIGNIASSFFKISVPPPRQQIDQIKTGDSLDISRILDYYRSMLYPVYDNIKTPRKLRSSPPLIVLFAGSAIAKIPYENRINSNHDLWVVTNLEIRVTKQLPNLAPMEAVVTFQLMQYNIRSFSGGRFSG